ncbi:class II aldolase/adducin family protein [Corynebacterium uterequi]|uniref:L-fuculose 1-phosphate aldolase n=1 Tax=Corynebacterium uterequi TaxID=1072256 RepID=A0A0G3HGQ0_9CORY|nr:class II aldolase/adducin family protein [Corynebacterium uterequi]AKK11945.1 L-fuculose 1-phosphate aldolase [Corynebacterium uterequi]
MLLAEERALIAEYCQHFASDGLVVGTAGNISIRVDDLVALTPTGLPYVGIRPEDICVVKMDTGELVEGDYQPTSEIHLHLQALETTGLNSVVHTHSTHATAVASMEGVTELPTIHYATAPMGGALPVTEYARYGSQLLADRVEEALRNHTGCLLGNHGSVAAGKDLAEAYTKALTIEWTAQVWLLARSAGTPRLLTSEQVADCRSAMATYGQPVKA